MPMSPPALAPQPGHVATYSSSLTPSARVSGDNMPVAVKVRIGATYPLADAAVAHRALEGRKTTGKVLLIP